MITRPPFAADPLFDQLLAEAHDRVSRAIAGGNESAIDAAKDAYFELRIAIDLEERRRELTAEDAR